MALLRVLLLSMVKKQATKRHTHVYPSSAKLYTAAYGHLATITWAYPVIHWGDPVEELPACVCLLPGYESVAWPR